jgi:hypothetical protein
VRFLAFRKLDELHYQANAAEMQVAQTDIFIALDPHGYSAASANGGEGAS